MPIFDSQTRDAIELGRIVRDQHKAQRPGVAGDYELSIGAGGVGP